MNPEVYQLLVCAFAAIGSFTYGYDLGIIGSVIPALETNPDFNPSATEEGLIVAFLTIGGAAGALSSGYLNDGVGRRISIVIATIVFILGAGLQAGAQSTHYLQAGRFVTGLGVGLVSTWQKKNC